MADELKNAPGKKLAPVTKTYTPKRFVGSVDVFNPPDDPANTRVEVGFVHVALNDKDQRVEDVPDYTKVMTLRRDKLDANPDVMAKVEELNDLLQTIGDAEGF